jgi:hypothetical protein
MMEVTKPVNASMPLPSADRAAVALEELMERMRSIGSDSSQCTRMTLSASAPTTYRAGMNQRPLESRRAARRQRVSLATVGTANLIFVDLTNHFVRKLQIAYSRLRPKEGICFVEYVGGRIKVYKVDRFLI